MFDRINRKSQQKKTIFNKSALIVVGKLERFAIWKNFVSQFVCSICASQGLPSALPSKREDEIKKSSSATAKNTRTRLLEFTKRTLSFWDEDDRRQTFNFQKKTTTVIFVCLIFTFCCIVRNFLLFSMTQFSVPGIEKLRFQ